MKKIITILILVLAGATSFAQYNHQPDNRGNNNTVYTRDNHYGENFARQREISRINQDFNYKVQSIESRIFMSRRKKNILIREAEMQRDQQIKMVYIKFSNYNNHADRFDRGR